MWKYLNAVHLNLGRDSFDSLQMLPSCILPIRKSSSIYKHFHLFTDLTEVGTLVEDIPTEFQGPTTTEMGRLPTGLIAEIQETPGLAQVGGTTTRDGTEMLGDTLEEQGEMNPESTG